ncbi:hypothetical protein HELRODRAFT_166708 [Helobdella robusta]|uniref:Uncharacterized protein n=1 Tax=Helobdella robusta TaxID=6412 RepID=T1EYE4_HELRO|nr:hypothetical protein HELRODRAFT_166708 [Helobdella robusta]ESO11693.1 hypothetical protein HELRODRAFT_166708 [Helobdella robusta]
MKKKSGELTYYKKYPSITIKNKKTYTPVFSVRNIVITDDVRNTIILQCDEKIIAHGDIYRIIPTQLPNSSNYDYLLANQPNVPFPAGTYVCFPNYLNIKITRTKQAEVVVLKQGPICDLSVSQQTKKGSTPQPPNGQKQRQQQQQQRQQHIRPQLYFDVIPVTEMNQKIILNKKTDIHLLCTLCYQGNLKPKMTLTYDGSELAGNITHNSKDELLKLVTFQTEFYIKNVFSVDEMVHILVNTTFEGSNERDDKSDIDRHPPEYSHYWSVYLVGNGSEPTLGSVTDRSTTEERSHSTDGGNLVFFLPIIILVLVLIFIVVCFAIFYFRINKKIKVIQGSTSISGGSIPSSLRTNTLSRVDRNLSVYDEINLDEMIECFEEMSGGGVGVVMADGGVRSSGSVGGAYECPRRSFGRRDESGNPWYNQANKHHSSNLYAGINNNGGQQPQEAYSSLKKHINQDGHLYQKVNAGSKNNREKKHKKKNAEKDKTTNNKTGKSHNRYSNPKQENISSVQNLENETNNNNNNKNVSNNFNIVNSAILKKANKKNKNKKQTLLESAGIGNVY